MQRPSRKRRGAAVVMVVVCLSLILGMAALAVDVGYMYNRHTEMQNAVDAGALAGASGLTTSDAEARTRAVQCASNNYLGPEAVSVSDGDVEIGNWEWGSQAFTPVAVPDPNAIRPNAVRLIGRRTRLPLFFAAILGKSDTNVVREAVALMDSGRCRGIWGLEGITANGDVITDSYNSSEGLYGPGNIRPKGDICSNEDITINGGVSIRGDAMHGPGYDLSISGGSYEIWGMAAGTCCAVEPPVADATEGQFDNDNATIGTNQDGLTDLGYQAIGPAGKLSLESTDNVTMWGGTYYFTSAKLVGSATITVGGPTVIYVDGNATFTGGGLINVTQEPSNLVIYCTGNTLKLGGGSEFYGAIVAPNTDVTLAGTADFYGTVIGQTLTMLGNFVVHVDEAVVADLLGDEAESPTLVK